MGRTLLIALLLLSQTTGPLLAQEELPPPPKESAAGDTGPKIVDKETKPAAEPKGPKIVDKETKPESDGKGPKIVDKEVPAEPASPKERTVDDVVADLKWWQVTNRETAPDEFPVTIRQVPPLFIKTAIKDAEETIFELKDIDGKKVEEPKFGFQLEGKGDDGKFKWAPVTDEEVEVKIKRAIELVWQGTPNDEIYLDDTGALYFRDKKLRVIFGFGEGDDSYKFPSDQQPVLLERFVTYLVGLTLGARQEEFNQYEVEKEDSDPEMKPVYFGVKYVGDTTPLKQADEVALQLKLAHVMAGEDVAGLSVDSFGRIKTEGKALIVRFYYLSKDPVTKFPEKAQRLLSNQLRRQFKEVLIVRRSQENARKNFIVQGESLYSEAEKLLAKTTSDKSLRKQELLSALEQLERGSTLLREHVKKEKEILAKLARVGAVKVEIEDSIDLLTFPIIAESPASCRLFDVRQENRQSWTLNHLGPNNKKVVIAIFSEKPKWVACQDNHVAIYGVWKEKANKDRFDLGASVALSPQSSNVTREQLAELNQPVLLYYSNEKMIAARLSAEEAPYTSAQFLAIGPKLAGLRIVADKNPYHAFEMNLDASLYRTRLVSQTANDTSGAYSYFLQDDNSVDVIQNTASTEQKRLNVRGFDVTKLATKEKSMVFKATEVNASPEIDTKALGDAGVAGLVGKSTVYLLVDGILKTIAQDSETKVYDSFSVASTGNFILRWEGNKTSFQEVGFDGNGLRTRLAVPSSCDSLYRFVLLDDASVAFSRLDAEGKEVAVATLGSVAETACAKDSVTFMLKKLQLNDPNAAATPLSAASNLTVAEMSQGLPSPALVTLVAGKPIQAFRAPQGLELKNLRTNANGFAFDLVSGANSVSFQIDDKGTWQQTKWLGSLSGSEHSLVLSGSEGKSGYLFHRGAMVAFLDNVKSASSHGDVVAVAANRASLRAALEEGMDWKATSLSIRKPVSNDISGENLLFTFKANKLMAVETSLSEKDGGVSAAVVMESQNSVVRWISFTKNEDYSLILDLDGQVIDPRAANRSFFNGTQYSWKSEPIAAAK